MFGLSTSLTLNETSSETIVIQEKEINSFESNWLDQWNQFPDSTSVELYLNQLIKSKLDYEPPLSLFVSPDSSALKTYYEGHLDNYVRPTTWNVFQAYFKADQQVQLKDFISTVPNPFDSVLMNRQQPLPYAIQGVDLKSLEEVFGDEISSEIERETPNHWFGPIESPFGWHMFFIERKISGTITPFEEAYIEVKNDWLSEQKLQQELKQLKELGDNKTFETDLDSGSMYYPQVSILINRLNE